jgi:hypothetical protein
MFGYTLIRKKRLQYLESAVEEDKAIICDLMCTMDEATDLILELWEFRLSPLFRNTNPMIRKGNSEEISKSLNLLSTLIKRTKEWLGE